MEESCKWKEVRSDKIHIYKAKQASNASREVDSDKSKTGAIQDNEDQETQNIPFRSEKFDKLHGLGLTTKIDFAGFILFYFGYLVFNIVYWVYASNYFYEKDWFPTFIIFSFSLT